MLNRPARFARHVEERSVSIKRLAHDALAARRRRWLPRRPRRYGRPEPVRHMRERQQGILKPGTVGNRALGGPAARGGQPGPARKPGCTKTVLGEPPVAAFGTGTLELFRRARCPTEPLQLVRQGESTRWPAAGRRSHAEDGRPGRSAAAGGRMRCTRWALAATFLPGLVTAERRAPPC